MSTFYLDEGILRDLKRALTDLDNLVITTDEVNRKSTPDHAQL